MAIAWHFVDVNDVARAHIFLMSNKQAYGRYIIAGQTYTLEMLLNRIIVPVCERERINEHTPWFPCDCFCCFPFVWCASFRQPKGAGNFLRTNLNLVPRYDTTRLQNMGFQFANVSKAIDETIVWAKECGLVKLE